jgi:drug/metabolite transporter (DMT)-like permease
VTPEKRRASPWIEASLLLTVVFFGTNFVAIKHVVESVPPILRSIRAAVPAPSGRLPVLYDLAITSADVGDLSQHSSTLRSLYPAPR